MCGRKGGRGSVSENGGRGRVTGTRRTHLPSQASTEAEGGTDDHLLHHGRLQTPQELRGREKRKVRQQSFLPPSAQPARQPLDAGIGGRGRAALREPAATSSRCHGLKSWSKPWSRVRRAWGQRKRRKRKRKKKGKERRGTYLHGRLGEDLWGLDNRWRRHDFSAVSLPSFPSDRVQLV